MPRFTVLVSSRENCVVRIRESGFSSRVETTLPAKRVVAAFELDVRFYGIR